MSAREEEPGLGETPGHLPAASPAVAHSDMPAVENPGPPAALPGAQPAVPPAVQRTEFSTPAPVTADAIEGLLQALRAAGVEVDASSRRRSEYAYDASIYRVRPAAVAFPRTVAEVQALLAACRDAGVPVTSRGGGTSMAGNAVGAGVVVDFSRHFRSVGRVEMGGGSASEPAPDPARAAAPSKPIVTSAAAFAGQRAAAAPADTAPAPPITSPSVTKAAAGSAATTPDGSVWADAGVVLSELRARVERETGGALTFAPDPSSHTRATLGGSLGNDACGNHSVAYGRISHHVLELELVTADGAHLLAGPGGVRPVDVSDARALARAEQITAELRALAAANLAPLRTELQRIPRQVSGYHLGHLLPEQGFDVAAALAGSEGTAAVIVRARMRLVPKLRATALVCVGYDSMPEAARDVMPMLALKPTAIEGLDGQIVAIMRARRGPESVSALPAGDAYVIVEFSADTAEAARADCERLVAELTRIGRARDCLVVTDPAERAKLWRVREDGAGLVSRGLDGGQAWPGWEDSAVAPERLADYLDDLAALIDRYGFTGPMYGHFGAGCVHVRIDFDLRSEPGRAEFGRFMREAAELVVAHGGSLSGEHGDGRARGEFLGLMYSERMLALFRDFKRVWDPQGLLNPGMIVDPPRTTESLALDGVPARAWERPAGRDPLPLAPGGTHPHPHQPGDPFMADVQACIGVGRCRATGGGFMCPSYRATRDEKDSTRGRSRVLQEMVRTASTPAEGWRSTDVMEALDLCLSCKACGSDCPAGVDMADVKSRFTSEFYRGRLRPFTHYSIGWLPRWIPLLTRAAPLVNWVAGVRPARAVASRLGISAERALPRFRPRRELARRKAEAGFVPGGDVVLFIDSFTGAFRPEVVPAAARVLQSGGSGVACAPDACCGLTFISTGQRDAAARRLGRLVARLDDGTDRPIVVLEPSCAAAIRDEAPKLVGGAAARRVAGRVHSFASAVRERQRAGWRPEVDPPAEAVLQTHCHEHAAFGPAVQRDVLAAWGVARVTESSSCCGVAGNFGFEREHYAVSMQVAEHSIVPALAAGDPHAPVLTDGFSCSMQVRQVDPGRAGQHLAQLMDPGPG